VADLTTLAPLAVYTILTFLVIVLLKGALS
jgi:hypothetical protein